MSGFSVSEMVGSSLTRSVSSGVGLTNDRTDKTSIANTPPTIKDILQKEQAAAASETQSSAEESNKALTARLNFGRSAALVPTDVNTAKQAMNSQTRLIERQDQTIVSKARQQEIIDKKSTKDEVRQEEARQANLTNLREDSQTRRQDNVEQTTQQTEERQAKLQELDAQTQKKLEVIDRNYKEAQAITDRAKIDRAIANGSVDKQALEKKMVEIANGNLYASRTAVAAVDVQAQDSQGPTDNAASDSMIVEGTLVNQQDELRRNPAFENSAPVGLNDNLGAAQASDQQQSSELNLDQVNLELVRQPGFLISRFA